MPLLPGQGLTRLRQLGLEQGAPSLEARVSGPIANGLPQTLVDGADSVSSGLVTSSPEETENLLRKLVSHSDDAQSMAVEKLERRIALRLFLEQDTHTKVILV